MKKTAIAIAVALAGFATLAQAAPKDNTWYAGGKLGWSRFHEVGNDAISNNGPIHKSQLGAGAFGGYQINPYVGFEMGYDWLGRMPYKGSADNGAFKTQGVQLTAKLGYPITDALDIYTRLGGMVWRADAKANSGFKDHDTGISPVFAGGLEWAITRDIATRLEYQWVNNIGDGNTVGGRPDNGMLSAGVSWRFGQQQTAPAVIAAAPVVAPQVQSKHFTLKSDVLFNFNKSTLKPEGQQALDQLYNQLSQLDSDNGSVAVLGFTDHIGSDAYNHRLSEKRAQSVVNYLIARGMSADNISARGMGKSDPVTGSSCDHLRARAALIECLAPDRRVEIEVKGVKDAATQPQS